MTTIRQAAFGGVLLVTIMYGWRNRRGERFKAILGILQGHPVLYRVKVEQVPALRIYGDHASVIGTTILGAPGIKIGTPK